MVLGAARCRKRIEIARQLIGGGVASLGIQGEHAEQDRLERPWRFVGHGCRPNRDTVAAIEASPLELRELERGRTPKAPEITKPLAQGVAVKAG